jgi:hypothetical protein
LSIEVDELGPNDVVLSLTFLSLGECQYHLSDFTEAEKNLRKAYSLQLMEDGENNPELKRVLELLLKTLIANKNDAEARLIKEKLFSLNGSKK